MVTPVFAALLLGQVLRVQSPCMLFGSMGWSSGRPMGMLLLRPC